MPENTPDISLDETLETLRSQAEVRWGADFVSEHQDLLELAASYVVNVGNNLPEVETEPGFYQ